MFLPLSISLYIFQLTRPRGARQTGGVNRCFNALFQPTRPRGARPVPECLITPSTWISTHAPARGATAAAEATNTLNTISTHAPARGATTL